MGWIGNADKLVIHEGLVWFWFHAYFWISLNIWPQWPQKAIKYSWDNFLIFKTRKFWLLHDGSFDRLFTVFCLHFAPAGNFGLQLFELFWIFNVFYRIFGWHMKKPFASSFSHVEGKYTLRVGQFRSSPTFTTISFEHFWRFTSIGNYCFAENFSW